MHAAQAVLHLLNEGMMTMKMMMMMMMMMSYLGDDDKCNGCGCDPCIGSKCPGRN